MNSNLNHSVISQTQISHTDKPLAVFLLGADGSGKSSLREYLNLSSIQTNIDPDALNRIAKNTHNENYLLFASKQALTMFKHATQNHLNLCMESTLAGKSAMKRLSQAKKRGYRVLVYFVGLSKVELNIKRVAERVQKGGHNIDRKLIIKRYSESIENLIVSQKHIDELHVIDNSKDYYNVQFSKYDNQFIQYDRLENWAKELFEIIKR